jgi:tetratricopeptide (TPR) repeat protein
MSRRRWLAILLGAGVIGAAALAHPRLEAWYHRHAGSRAVEQYHSDEGLCHLQACLKVWPADGEARLLAARAARQTGRLEDAAYHLTCAQQALGDTEPVLLEWALHQASAGDLSVEPYLQARARKSTAPEAALIDEALVLGYLRLYRFRDAIALLNHWLERSPNHTQALFLRGRTWRARHQLTEAVADFRRALEQDSGRDDTRWELASCLVELHDYEEARPLSAALLQSRPGDPDVVVELARCDEGLGQTEVARAALENMLRTHPDHAGTWRERGRMELEAGHPAEAEEPLRRCLALAPHDLAANGYLAEVLVRQGKKDAAEVQEARTRELKDCAARLRQISENDMTERPTDPALHAEIGTLELRLGRPENAQRWLQLALAREPSLPAAHAALAEYFEGRGDAERAAAHRALVPQAAAEKNSKRPWSTP